MRDRKCSDLDHVHVPLMGSSSQPLRSIQASFVRPFVVDCLGIICMIKHNGVHDWIISAPGAPDAFGAIGRSELWAQ